MKTPVCDFVRAYGERGTLRLHMPGHKGRGETERADITEIAGADVLYHARGILRESEDNAAALFGSGRTVYSAEGASLCIRAMLFLALLRARERGAAPLILAGRNAHSALISAAALLDFRVEWLYGRELLTCLPEAAETAERLDSLPERPAAVYLTSPDYLGARADIGPIARVCHARGIPLLVDNAHGAYLRFLEKDEHPLARGADLVCDSAHKTLPVLTGGAYLHIHRDAPETFFAQAERAMALFASTSPSWLILQSLDRCNALLAEGYPERIRRTAERLARLKNRLTEAGCPVSGDPLRLTLSPKAYGYTGDGLHDLLRRENMECEFSDPDYLVMMVTPETAPEELDRVEEVLAGIPRRAPLTDRPPAPPRAERAMSVRDAMLAPAEEVPLAESVGRILADACVSCPPAVPILTGGERISAEAVRCFRYYGMTGPVTCVLAGAEKAW